MFSSIQISYRNAGCESNDRYNNSVRYDIKEQAYIWNRWRWESVLIKFDNYSADGLVRNIVSYPVGTLPTIAKPYFSSSLAKCETRVPMTIFKVS